VGKPSHYVGTVARTFEKSYRGGGGLREEKTTGGRRKRDPDPQNTKSLTQYDCEDNEKRGGKERMYHSEFLVEKGKVS